MTTISATNILASRHAITGDRLDTLLLRFPRCILAEFNTHRVFSRNAASSRAIPVAKLIEDVEADPFVPLVWGANQKGMQASEELTGTKLEVAKDQWTYALEDAVYRAKNLAAIGAHKQIVNRLLEPFAHVTVVVSSTTWDGFLAQRDHADAEPHMQMLAKEIRKALDGATVQTLQPGEWHTPFITDGDYYEIERVFNGGGNAYRDFISMEDRRSALNKLSVARCASTSYKTVDGFDMSLERATEIYDKLRHADPIHASPFEHVAQADEWNEWGDGDGGYWHPAQHRNFRGFRQLRAVIEGERG